MIKTYYHGTSADNLQLILKHGILPVRNRIWVDSMPDRVYLWEADPPDGYPGACNAAESGAIALLRAKDKRIVVFRVEMSDTQIFPDGSGDGMAEQGAVEAFKVPPGRIKGYSISEDLSMILPWIARHYFAQRSHSHEQTALERHVISEIEGGGELVIIDELPIQWTDEQVNQVRHQPKAKARSRVPRTRSVATVPATGKA